MQYLLVRNAKFDPFWEPGAPLVSGEILLESESFSDCREIIQKCASQRVDVDKEVESKWEEELAFHQTGLEEANAFCLKALRGEQPDFDFDYAYFRHSDDLFPSDWKEHHQKMLSVFANRPDNVLDLLWMQYRENCDYNERHLIKLQSELAHFQETTEGHERDAISRKITYLMEEFPSEPEHQQPNSESVENWIKGLTPEFDDRPDALWDDGESQMDEFAKSYTIFVKLTSWKTLFREIKDDFTNYLHRYPSSPNYHWYQDYYDEIERRLVYLPSNGDTAIDFRRHVACLSRAVSKLANLSEQEKEWLWEDLLK